MFDNKARDLLAKTFLDALKENQIPWHRCWNARPVNFMTGKPYHGMNNIALSYAATEKGYRDTRWMTYKQATDHGWYVKKGEKASRVEYWHYYDKALGKNLEPAEVNAIRQADPARMKDIRLVAYVYSVFNAEQIVGVPEQAQLTSHFRVDLIQTKRDILLANMGVGFQEGGDRAFYQPSTDTITLPFAQHYSSDYGYVCTLLHEAGHATGHESRLNRQLGSAFGSIGYAKEELRAEIASAFTAQVLGIPFHEEELGEHIELHKAYIQSWIQVLENDPNELFTAIKDADHISDYLLEHARIRDLATAPSAEQFHLHGLSDELDIDLEP